MTPELAGALAVASRGADAFFGAVHDPISIDVGVMERSKRVVVLPGDFGWDDVGTWGALHRLRRKDTAGNAVHGLVHADDARDNVVHAEGSRVVLFGVEGLVVVVRDGVTLVTTVERADSLKTLVDRMPAEFREAAGA